MATDKKKKEKKKLPKKRSAKAPQVAINDDEDEGLSLIHISEPTRPY